MKRFKTKKKHIFIKLILFILVIIISFIITINILFKLNNKIDNDKLIKYIISNGFNNQISNLYNPLDLTNPLELIENNLSININNKVIEVLKEDNNILEPLIYIYNTHDEEKYYYNKYNVFNIVPDVKIASYILKERLDDLGKLSIVETNKISNILKDNNLSYKESYKGSRILLTNIINKYPSIKYYIDIHRDSSKKDKTLLNYNNKDYAKVLFVIGLENNNYEYNLKIANYLDDDLNKSIPGLSRGVLKKSGSNVNGIYNQDISHNCILIEIGGVDNNIEEVNNTIYVLANSISKYIEGDMIEDEKL